MMKKNYKLMIFDVYNLEIAFKNVGHNRFSMQSSANKYNSCANQ